MNELKRERIALEVIKTLKSRFDNFPEDASDNRNAPFHESFLKAFKLKLEEHVTNVPIFVSLASWMHGLNTSIGQSFFEKVAHILCDGEKKEFKELLISETQRIKINDIITSLKNGKQKPDLSNENKELFEKNEQCTVSIANFSADVYYEEDDKIVAIELKTVKPNSGVFKVEKEKILSGKGGLKNKYPQKEIYFYLGFPFDPLNEQSCGFNKTKFFNYSVDFKKFFDPNEVLLADELWDFLSDEENTMENILKTINSISTPDFMAKFNLINDQSNFQNNSKEFINILKEWFLQRELKIAYAIEASPDIFTNNKQVKRVLRQSLFDNQNNYRENRINTLLNSI